MLQIQAEFPQYPLKWCRLARWRLARYARHLSTCSLLLRKSEVHETQPNQHLQVVENVQAISGGVTTDGVLRLTDHHLVFCAPPRLSNDEPTQPPQPPPKARERWIPYPLISNCIYRPVPFSSRQAASIRLRCRDFSYITFNLADNNVARDLFEFLKSRTCKLRTVEKLYAFKHRPLKHEKEINGWEFYDAKEEFKRQGISEKLSDKGWRVTNINQDYSFCDTYPAFLVVPSKISDNVLKYAKDFRTRNRIPALAYLHPVNNCTITRSSQPYSGITRSSNIQDEKLVAASFSAFHPDASEGSTPLTSQGDGDEGATTSQTDLSDPERSEDDLNFRPSAMYDEKTGERRIYGAQQRNLIVDARPKLNAMFNQAVGMGSENMDKYKFARKGFLNIGNIHVMRNSLDKVIEALKDADLSPLPPNRDLLHKSEWLRHTHNVLDGSAVVAHCVGITHSNVLIHCSDGWDRTSQLSALAQIMLDPYFRTINGFITLIEKDWLSFGHMFRLRSGHLSHEDWFITQKDAYAGARVQPGEQDGRNDAFQNVFSGAKRFLAQGGKDNADLEAISELASGEVVKDELTTLKMVSPVFHQFLDCTYQLLRQHPTRFEFTERFLRRLLYHLYSCQYGTFLYNSEKQRRDAKVAERTSSVWDYFLSRKAEFTNPNYDATVDDKVKGQERLIFPTLTDLRWWYQLYGRTDDEMNRDLKAAAAAASDRQAAVGAAVSESLYSSVIQSEEEPRTSNASGQPPSLVASQSALVSGESAHQALTPDATDASLRRSVSAEGLNPLATIRDGIAGLGFGKGFLGGVTGRPDEPASSTSQTPRSGQELREMT